MKTLNLIVLSLLFTLQSFGSLPLYAVEETQAVSDHVALAASYEEKAAAQDIVIGEHTKMKQDYKARFFVNEKVSPMNKIQGMVEHCDAIIKDAQKLKSEYLEFAKWHRMRAAELQGR